MDGCTWLFVGGGAAAYVGIWLCFVRDCSFDDFQSTYILFMNAFVLCWVPVVKKGLKYLGKYVEMIIEWEYSREKKVCN